VDHWDLSGRVVIVTGASSGIGARTARLAHAAGAVRTGEERIDIPHGPERPDLTAA
jgi:NAD(P)-dependent dehydrogenase (short-subunit alcohol dehydrogenase family)